MLHPALPRSTPTCQASSRELRADLPLAHLAARRRDAGGAAALDFATGARECVCDLRGGHMEHPAPDEMAIPRHEIDRRLAAVRQRMADRGLEPLIVLLLARPPAFRTARARALPVRLRAVLRRLHDDAAARSHHRCGAREGCAPTTSRRRVPGSRTSRGQATASRWSVTSSPTMGWSGPPSALRARPDAGLTDWLTIAHGVLRF